VNAAVQRVKEKQRREVGIVEPPGASRDAGAQYLRQIRHGNVVADVLVGLRLGLGRPDASQDEVERAAALAQAHDFIQTLPQGYETICGERGARLSGGQRQRIAIARAFLRGAPILILDEAVSNLDTQNEQALQAAMDEVRRGRTVLVIAHRLSTIRNADRIAVLDGGRIVEEGRHDELLARGGAYARLIATSEAIR
jgi:ATP-binding cassette, subfamily C, bacterial CydC